MASDWSEDQSLQDFVGDSQTSSPLCQRVREPFSKESVTDLHLKALLDHASYCVGCQEFYMRYYTKQQQVVCQYFRQPFTAGLTATKEDRDALLAHAQNCILCTADNVMDKVDANESL